MFDGNHECTLPPLHIFHVADFVSWTVHVNFVWTVQWTCELFVWAVQWTYEPCELFVRTVVSMWTMCLYVEHVNLVNSLCGLCGEHVNHVNYLHLCGEHVNQVSSLCGLCGEHVNQLSSLCGLCGRHMNHMNSLCGLCGEPVNQSVKAEGKKTTKLTFFSGEWNFRVSMHKHCAKYCQCHWRQTCRNNVCNMLQELRMPKHTN